MVSAACIISAPWLCWAIQGMALLLIGLFIWRMVKRHKEGPATHFGEEPSWNAEPATVPVRRGPNGPAAPGP